MVSNGFINLKLSILAVHWILGEQTLRGAIYNIVYVNLVIPYKQESLVVRCG